MGYMRRNIVSNKFKKDLEAFLKNKNQSLVKFKSTSVMDTAQYTATEKRRATRWLRQSIRNGGFTHGGYWIREDPDTDKVYLALSLDGLSDADLLELVLDTMKCERKDLIEGITECKRRLHEAEETEKELKEELNHTNHLIFQMCVECKTCKKDICRDMKCPLWVMSPKRSKIYKENNI